MSSKVVVKRSRNSFNDLLEIIDEIAVAVVDEISEEMKSTTQKQYTDANFYSYDTSGNDVTVSVDKEEKPHRHKRTVIAEGNDVLFLEYGTGINYPQDPNAPPEYQLKSWSYGEQGKKQVDKRRSADGRYFWYYNAKQDGKDIVRISYGNPAYMIMYNETQRIKNEKLLEKRIREQLKTRGLK